MAEQSSKWPITRRHFLGASALLLAGPGLLPAKPKEENVPGAAIFEKPTLLDFAITLAPGGENILRKDPRTYVPARMTVDGQAFAGVGMHLKGSQGSVRPVDDKPAITVKLNKYVSGERLYGLRKIHLNNSVQDPSYLCEYLTGELFRRAGVPATRVAWATVQLDGRKMGLFVLKEGFDKDFVEVNFKHAHGNLYDGGLHHEVNEPLERDCGDGPNDHADLKALAAAAMEPDVSRRWQRLGQTLDIERFISFMAMEILTDHIDGYCLMQNNYRLYVEPKSQRAIFLPHGTDRMFGNPRAPIEPQMRALVARAVMSTPQGRARYRTRMGELLEKVFRTEWINPTIDAVVGLLEPVQPLVVREAQALRVRITARAAFARQSLGAVATG